jgi:hypothetical protein
MVVLLMKGGERHLVWCQPDAPDGSDHQGERLSPDEGDSPRGVGRACRATVTGLQETRITGMSRDGQGAMPGWAGRALVTLRLLSGHSRERSGQGRSAGEIAAGRGPQAVLRLGAFRGACAGRPAVSHTVPWYQVSARDAIGA